ncbi:hypothetical protein PNEG_03349 [Pneumocystis murina B123]|uniref:Uncharacterized protein n=1 Tax=Pneumocystis murina (strain B123) TaxID=1069680 RepID=M7NM09_PNEMU|nr:hypothetical protein PNEG_03349 [Pneumocystis murina B123]EMR08176.1 hypothetical protein PNEG_03349 [Pneumocystis murina B123]
MSNKKYKIFSTKNKNIIQNAIEKIKTTENQTILLSIAVFTSAIMFFQSNWAEILIPQL